MRQLKYREAIDEATRQAMAKDERVFVMGVGVDDAKGIFGTTRGAFEQFGPRRVFDTPLSEAALTGMGVGRRCAASIRSSSTPATISCC